MKDILQSDLGMKKVSRCWASQLLSEAQKTARVEISKEMLRILQDSEEKNFEGIVTGDESWFRD
jgi:hypothetical protein